MIELHMGILKLSVMGNILPISENCPAAGQPLVVRCWNYLLTHVEEDYVESRMIPVHQRMQDKTIVPSQE